MTLAELYGVEEVPTISESIQALLAKFEDVFDWPKELPQKEVLSIIYTQRKAHTQLM